ncbi:MAG: hypothetical protein A3K12_15250 [Candidatus Rokubacteria bacterium RIFCSPLOWO2_12_FULL_71_19]|nr:MAG: hypothetical protein A3K12_15250 [Candidatus Rokubacteria bacterium RIFCSPLOWO2_12_FULL_71_19]
MEHPRTVAPPPAPLGGWRGWLRAAVDLLFPPICPVCQVRLDAGRRDPLCGSCWERLERIAPPICRLCGLPLGGFAIEPHEAGGGPAPHLCGQCRVRPPAYSYARAAARYGDVVREAVHAFKFGGKRALALPLGDLLAETRALLPIDAVDLLVPVPLHRRRERERGFNQSRLLARRVACAWGVPLRADVLARAAATLPQTDLGAAERRANVRGAFALRRPDAVAGRHVVLVDDIMTTGATAGACAALLQEAGAATVGVVTVARVV